MATNQTAPASMPTIVTRREWGGVAPRIFPRMELLKYPVPLVVVSYFIPWVTDDILALQVMQKRHMDAGEPDIQANFLIGKNGTIYEGRGWRFKPAKSIEFPQFDGKYIEIGYIGDFNNVSLAHPVMTSTWAVLDYGKLRKFLAKDFRILSEKDKEKRVEK